MDYTQRYVCGFLFDRNCENVVLMVKTKPEWQKGKVNGVGGKVEEGETPYQAMVREFKEETGVSSEPPYWNEFAVYDFGMFVRIHFFKACDHAAFMAADTMEEEEVIKVPTKKLREYNVIWNLNWLIPMALDGAVFNAKIENFIPSGEG